MNKEIFYCIRKYILYILLYCGYIQKLKCAKNNGIDLKVFGKNLRIEKKATNY